MKLKLYLVCFCALGTFYKLNAQADGKVLINTVYDDPYKNYWGVALFAGLELQSKSSGGLYYGAAGRFSLAKVATFSANVGLDLTKLSGSGGIVKVDQDLASKLPSYKNIELRAVYHLKDYEGSKNNKVSLGSDGSYEYSTNYATKSRRVTGITASLNVNGRAYVQNVDSIEVLKIKDPTSGESVGYLQGISTGQNNVFIGAGIQIAEYTFFKGKFTGGAHGTAKTRRIKRSVNTNFELLFAPAIIVSDEAYIKRNGVLETYEVNEVEKKNFGFRITADILNGKPGWFTRVELGKKPGIEAPLKLDSKLGKFLTNGYFSFAFGFGF